MISYTSLKTTFDYLIMLALEGEIFSAIVAAPFGYVGVRTDAMEVSELVYLPPRFQEKSPTNRIAERTAQQIAAYFHHADSPFDLPIKKLGTEFQQRVWRAIAAIPRGKVQTYGQIAKKIGSAPRAVGQACGANWFPLIIPCHRVTAAAGLGGFAHHDDENGFHLGIKRYLLAHENVQAYSVDLNKQHALW